MFTTRNLKAAGALLIAAACLSPNAAPGANLPKGGSTNAARVQFTTDSGKVSPVTSARSTATTQVTPAKLKKIKGAAPRTVTPSPGSPLAKSRSRSAALKPTVAGNKPRVSSIRPKVSGFKDADAQRDFDADAERIRRAQDNLRDKLRDLKSSEARAQEKLVQLSKILHQNRNTGHFAGGF